MNEGTLAPHLTTTFTTTRPYPLPTNLGYRANAIFQGTLLSHLPTASLFAYAKHFDATPSTLDG